MPRDYEAESKAHFDKYTGYYDVEECLTECDVLLLASLCRQRGREIATLNQHRDTLRTGCEMALDLLMPVIGNSPEDTKRTMDARDRLTFALEETRNAD